MRFTMVLVALVVPLAAMAAEPWERPLDFSVSAGAALPGRIEASWYDDFDPDYTEPFFSTVSPLVRASVTWWPDQRLAPVAPTIALHYGLLLLPEPYNAGFWDDRDHWIPDDGIHFVEVEGGVRLRWATGGSLTVDPAVSLGYCRTFSTSIDARDSGMILDVSVDLRWWRARWQPLATIGFMVQVYGGVEDIVWVRSDPVVYAALGAGW